MKETYTLTITKDDNGVFMDEQSTFSEFEIMGILTHLIQKHSLELAKKQEEYEQQRLNG